ncbi:hypothetical protein D9619_012550 [Psilocybe cf. subviscida]|uniref:GST N-terminal domain-containing protein n=1 Tax=Psilocybe cf. subviscida TaxID=2480587 RepID=A0A8H5EZ30_9AGAR|nr:hypothetical protein D9619_012550 [Psilocybe cf. subviscida]
MVIILYDLATRTGETISPNQWKTKLCLYLKRISFEIKSVGLHEVQQVLAREGLPPARKRADGSPYYSIPAIHDLSTGVKLCDSWEIALYLDKTYPDTHRLFPEGTISLQRAFSDSFRPHFNAGYLFFFPCLPDLHIPEARDHITQVIEQSAGKPIDKILPQGEEAVVEWDNFKAGLSKLEGWYSYSNGLFLMGDAPVWADLPVIALLLAYRTAWGKDSEKWKDVSSWNDGRWGALVAYFDALNIVN